MIQTKLLLILVFLHISLAYFLGSKAIKSKKNKRLASYRVLTTSQRL